MCANQVAGAPSLALDVREVAPTAQLQRHYLRFLPTLKVNSHNPDFRASDLAKIHGVSPRYLHKIIAALHTTYSAEISKVRLEHAAEIVSTAKFDDVDVAEIAGAADFPMPAISPAPFG